MRSRATTSRRWWASVVGSAAVGSSMTMSDALRASARMISTFWRSAAPSVATMRPGDRARDRRTRPPRRSRRTTRAVRRRSTSQRRPGSMPSMTFSAIVRRGSSVGSWAMIVMPSASASTGLRRRTGPAPSIQSLALVRSMDSGEDACRGSTCRPRSRPPARGRAALDVEVDAARAPRLLRIA